VKFHRCLLVSLAGAGLLATPWAHAAPDNTRGMAIMAAEVDSGGVLQRGSGATSAVWVGPGIYNVQFNRDVTSCYPVATLGSNAGVPSGTAGASQNGTLVTVATTNPAGTLTDKPFHLLVFCNR